MQNLTPEQKAMLKNLAMLAAFYFGVKATNKLVRYSVIAGLGYVIIKGHSPAMAGMGMKIDPHMAVDMLFPDMADDKKSYTKLAASELMKGMFSRNPDVGFERFS